jgi:hypothetical protein
LENSGKTGHVSLIDSSPKLMKILTLEQFKSEELCEDLLGRLMCSHILDNGNQFYTKEIATKKTWEEKVEKIANFDQKIYGKEYIRLVLTALSNRLKLIFRLENDFVSELDSSLTLVRPSATTVTNIEENYNLQENFRQKVQINFLEGDHFSILENSELVDLLNQHHLKI